MKILFEEAESFPKEHALTAKFQVMHLKAIDDNMLRLSKRLAFLKEFSFYLSGGTGLALQLKHRKSFDFDFFTGKEFSPEELSIVIKQHKIQSEGEIRRHGTLYCVLGGVKSSFIFYDDTLIFPTLKFNSIDVADWRDIVIEKLRTVGDRGQRKDFYDLFFGIKKLGIDNLIDLAHKKFGRNVNYFHLLKGITYFADAEKNPEPMLLVKGASWKEVKKYFTSNIHGFENAFKKILS